MNAVALTIVSVLLILSIVQSANALLYPKSALELYNENEIVATGKIISITKGLTNSTFVIAVDEYLKNPRPDDTITGINTYLKRPGYVFDPLNFTISDKGIFYLKIENDNFLISPYSFKVNPVCNPHQLLASPRPDDDVLSVFYGDGQHTINRPVLIAYDVINEEFASRSHDVEIFIKKHNEREPLFHKKQKVDSPACEWYTTLWWSFMPKDVGYYQVKVASKSGTAFEYFLVR